jgi:hypothetical protein
MNKYSDELIDYVLNLLTIISNNYKIITYVIDEEQYDQNDSEPKKEFEGENIFNCVDQPKFLIDILNNYVRYYKLIKKKGKISLFENIDDTNPSSTNHILEEFYEKMIEYKTFPEKRKLYKYTDKILADDEQYGLLVDGMIIYKSCSLFALLIEQTNIQYENKNKISNIILLN